MHADTHMYDGKLRDRLASFRSFLVEAASQSAEDKSAMFDSIAEEIKKTRPGAELCFIDALREARSNRIGLECDSYAVLYINRIKQDMLSKSSANYDPTNDVYADDVLWLCGKILTGHTRQCLSNKNDFVKELAMNLEDMRFGDCPQGRTTRLLQVMFSFEEFILAP